MRLIFKQKLFSWFDSFDVYDEQGNTYFTVQGKLAWSHKFVILDRRGQEIGYMQERVFHIPHTFDFHTDKCDGQMIQHIALFRQSLELRGNHNYRIDGDYFGWDYNVYKDNIQCGHITKKLLNWTDTYSVDCNEEDALMCLIILLCIDAVKCDHSH